MKDLSKQKEQGDRGVRAQVHMKTGGQVTMDRVRDCPKPGVRAQAKKEKRRKMNSKRQNNREQGSCILKQKDLI